MKFLTWFHADGANSKYSMPEAEKLEPFFFFPHGALTGQLERGLKRLCGHMDDERARQVVKVFARGPDLIATRIGNKEIFANSRD